jgi:hypothetical protein
MARQLKLSHQIEDLLSQARKDLLSGEYVKTASAETKVSSLSGTEAKALASIADLIRKEASWEPSYNDLENFIGGYYGKR